MPVATLASWTVTPTPLVLTEKESLVIRRGVGEAEFVVEHLFKGLVQSLIEDNSPVQPCQSSRF